YKEVVYETVEYGKPLDILADIERLESEIADGLRELKALIS
ncbi:SAM-dependent DNA methyltransferase, partial [bacterium M00.F.Ca.ET.230.01.1.1]